LTSQVPPSIDSKRVFTSYPWSGSVVRSPSTPYLSDKLSITHTQYACAVCNRPAAVSRGLFEKPLPAEVTCVRREPGVPADIADRGRDAWNRRRLHAGHRPLAWLPRQRGGGHRVHARHRAPDAGGDPGAGRG